MRLKERNQKKMNQPVFTLVGIPGLNVQLYVEVEPGPGAGQFYRGNLQTASL